MCITHTPAPVATATPTISGSLSNPETSLMISAPASMAAAAIDAFRVSIESGSSSESASRRITGITRSNSSLGRHWLSTRSRAFAADVEDVGAVGSQLQRMPHRHILIKKLAAVREAIRRNVDDSHQERPPSQIKRAGPQSPSAGGNSLHAFQNTAQRRELPRCFHRADDFLRQPVDRLLLRRSDRLAHLWNQIRRRLDAHQFLRHGD